MTTGKGKAQKLTFPYRGGTRFTTWIGTKARADKTLPQGGDYILPRDKWPALSEIQGNDETVLRSKTMNEAFENVLRLHRPFHRTVLFSLCTATRPYSKARKWAKYVEHFERYADLVVHSNGGIVPIEMEGQFPYLNYDAKGQSKFDRIYIEVGIKRVLRFLTAHRYANVLFNYRHNMRNFQIALRVGPEAKRRGLIEDYAILPTEKHYAQAKEEDFGAHGFKMYPELWPCMFDPVLEKLKEWHNAHR